MSCGITGKVADMLRTTERWAYERIPQEIYADLDHLHPPAIERCCTSLVTDLPNPYNENSFTEYQAWYEGEIECQSPDSTPGQINSQGYGRLIEIRSHTGDYLELHIQIGLFDHDFQPVFAQDDWVIFNPGFSETNV